MDRLLEELEAAVEASLHIVSIMSALTIPDICGALEHSDSRANRSRYMAWYREWMEDKYTWHKNHPTVRDVIAGRISMAIIPGVRRGDSIVTFQAEECYRFRCALLHQGKALHQYSKYSRYVYVKSSPTHSSVVFHNTIVVDNGKYTLLLDIPRFCSDMVSSCRAWLNAKKKNRVVQENLREMIQERNNRPTPVGPCDVIA